MPAMPGDMRSRTLRFTETKAASLALAGRVANCRVKICRDADAHRSGRSQHYHSFLIPILVL